MKLENIYLQSGPSSLVQLGYCCYSHATVPSRGLAGWEASRRALGGEGVAARAGLGWPGSWLGHLWGWLGRPEGRQGRLPANTEKKRRASNGDGSPENKNEMEMGQSVMDSCNRIYHGVENEEIYVWVVLVVVAGTRRLARKSSSET